MVTYGSYPWTVDDYVRLAAAFPFRWWASLDYCVEQEVAGYRDEVLDRMSRTIRANIECRLRAEGAGHDAPLMQDIQGGATGDYVARKRGVVARRVSVSFDLGGARTRHRKMTR